MEQIAQTLKQLGLDEKETKVYLALLRLGQTTVSQVAQAAAVERTGTYDVLERLQKQGLVRQVEIGKIVNFAAEDPKKLLTDLESRRQKLEQLIPQLANLYGGALLRPLINIYESRDGVRELLTDILKTQTREILVIYTLALSEIVGEDFMERLEKQRVENRITLRVLVSRYHDTDYDIIRTNLETLITARLAPEGMELPFTSYLSDYKTALISAKKSPYGWLVESPDFAKYQKALFEGIWLISRPL